MKSTIILSLVLVALVVGVIVVLASSKARGTKTNQAMKISLKKSTFAS